MLRSDRFVKKICAAFLIILLFVATPMKGADAQESPDDIQFEPITTADGLPSDVIEQIMQDHRGFIWIATNGGLSRYDGYEFKNYRSDAANPNSLNSNFIKGIYEDGDGIFWVATGDQGLNRFDPATEVATHFVHDPDDPTTISDNDIRTMYADHAGIIWLGTRRGGLNRFDPATGMFTHYKHEEADPDSIGADFVEAIFEDRQGVLWLGAEGEGLIRFDRQTEAFTHYQYDPSDLEGISDTTVKAIFEDAQGRLWVGTRDGGLNLFDRRTETFQHYRHAAADLMSLSDDFVQCLVPVTHDPTSDDLWVCTDNGGVNRFSPTTGQFTRYQQDRSDPASLSNNHVVSVYTDASAVLWVATYNGVNKFATNDLPTNSFLPPVAVTRFKLFNEEVLPASSVLEQSIIETTSITLAHNDDQFSFEFAALDYADPQAIQYQYKLAGLDAGWTTVDANQRRASYTNPPTGSYTFQVRATNSQGVWSDKETLITLTILPPWWETAFFAGSVFVTLLTLVGGGVFWRLRTIEARNRQLEIVVETRTEALKLAQAQADDARQKAESANQAKSRFLANMSHELRSPLNAILGFSTVIRRSNRLDTETQDQVEIIQKSGEHLLSLINQVLDLSKIEAGRTTLNTGDFDLHLLLDDIENMLALRAQIKQLRLIVTYDDGLPQYVHGDGVKLRQVLINLLSNGIKFTSEGHVSLQVAVQQQNRGGDFPAVPLIDFAIADTGPGISSQDMEVLFKAFSQAELGQQAQEGTGLGLAISQHFVRLMGGELKVASQVGEGSIFSFAVELNPVEVNRLVVTPPTRLVVGLQPDQPRYRILVVDDKAVNRQLLRQLLSGIDQSGTVFALKEASNGEEAIALWEAWQPHLIFMDMGMPVMDGYEATRRIKADVRGGGTAVIAFTASVFEEEQASIWATGCDDFVRKPFREEDIFAILESHLGVRFIYDEGDKDRDATQDGLLEGLTPEVLRTVAEPLLQKLEHGTTRLDTTVIDDCIAEISIDNITIAQALKQLADDFQYAEIKALIQSARSA